MSLSVQDLANLVGAWPGRLRFDEPSVAGMSAGMMALRFASSGGEDIPAVYLPPAKPGSGAVLYLHAHGNRPDIGLRELSEGRPALSAPWLDDLRTLGLAALCLEMPGFGSRSYPGESARSKAALWHGETMFGQMLSELLAGFAWLADRTDIDEDRIGCAGISMGGTQAFWLAALEPRLACAVSLCAFADLGKLIAMGLHDHHGAYMTVPGLLKRTSTGRMVGLAAPMPLFIGVGMKDWSSPPEAFAPARNEVQAAYAAAGSAGALQFHVEPEAGHEETRAMRLAARGFLARHLSDRVPERR